MNSFELNKIFGAILGTLVFVMGVGFIADEIYAPIENRGANYALPEPEETAEGAAPEEPGIEPIAVRMQSASADAGESLIVRCQSCHDYSSANTNRVGPGLYGVVGHDIASHEGFSYSEALASLGAAGETWDYENLDAFLTSPREFAPGTTMGFAGLSSPEDRANLIAFLRENSDDPYPLPEAAPAEEGASEDAATEGDEAAAEEEAPAGDGAATEEEGPSDQPVVDEVEELNLEQENEGDGAEVIEAEDPQADPTPTTDEAVPGAGQPAGDPADTVEADDTTQTTTN